MIATALLAGCTPRSWMHEPGMPGEFAREDTGGITGSWREVVRDGRRVSNGFALSIGHPHPYTFAAQKGCVATGGVLSRAGNNRYRVQRYQSGFAAEGCGPWQAGPEVAPFDGSEVELWRVGDRLFARGDGRLVELRRLMLSTKR